MDQLLDRIHRRLVDEPAGPTEMARIVREEAGVISDRELLDLLRKVGADLHGAGPLDALLSTPGVTDILVNGPSKVFIDRGHGLEKTDLTFSDDEEVRRLASRFAGLCGRRLDDAQPFVDGRMTRADGTPVRVHAALAPPSRSGTLISLRVLGRACTRLDDLVAQGSMDEQMAQRLREMVRARMSFVVTGGTGSGKTTLLSALIAEVPHSERIITIEDTAELDPQHPHVVGLVTRAANTEGTGAISMSDLLIQALRMRPDRLIVGEIRGGEVVDLLAALNTGHDGGAGTVHANSAAEVPARMEALAALGGMGRDALHTQLAAALKYVLVMERGRDGVRRLAQIARLTGNPVVAETVWQAGELA